MQKFLKNIYVKKVTSVVIGVSICSFCMSFPGNYHGNRSPSLLKRRTQYVSSEEVERSRFSSSSIPVVYTDGCCRSNGKKGAIGGIGVYWGPKHPKYIPYCIKISRFRGRVQRSAKLICREKSAFGAQLRN